MTVDDDKEVTLEKAYDNYQEFGVVYEPKVAKKAVKPEDEEEPTIINNNNNEEEKPTYVKLESKVEKNITFNINTQEEDKEDEEEKHDEEIQNIPSREEKKKETKVDDDFFKLIDSMYKERVDD